VTDGAEWACYVSRLLSVDAKLRACLTRYTHNRADTDELVQETYARLLAIETERAREIQSVAGFALVVARRIALDWLKHRKSLPIELLPDSDIFVLPDEDTGDIANCYQEIEQLIARVTRLPPKCGQVFTLRKMYGFSQREVGELLNVTVHTVEQHMLKATRTLRAGSAIEQPFSLALPLRRRKSRIKRRIPRTLKSAAVSRQTVSSWP
jgi:RNA polymerase sigma-70 factor (ECF subfamily)